MKHTTTTEQNLAHIDRLRTHGAKVRINGELKEINSFFWDGAVSECITKGYNAIAYELVIPETDEMLLLFIYSLPITTVTRLSSLLPKGCMVSPFASVVMRLA